MLKVFKPPAISLSSAALLIFFKYFKKEKMGQLAIIEKSFSLMPHSLYVEPLGIKTDKLDHGAG